MPRLYATVDDLLDSEAAESLGLAIPPDRLIRPLRRLTSALRKASARVDVFAQRRFGSPQPTTLTAPVAPGDTTVQVAGVFQWDARPDIILQLEPGSASAEYLQVQGWVPDPEFGGIPPFPGTVLLYPGVTAQYNHSTGAPVQPYFYEFAPLRQGSMEAYGSDFSLTQEGQIAMAHAPQGSTGAVVRRGFLTGYPIMKIANMNIVYPWANVSEPVPVLDLFIDFEAGSFRFPIGFFTPDKSIAVTTYLGGFTSFPEQVVDAVVSEALALLVRRFIPYGTTSHSSNGQSYNFGSGGKSLYSLDAQAAIGGMKNLAPY